MREHDPQIRYLPRVWWLTTFVTWFSLTAVVLILDLPDELAQLYQPNIGILAFGVLMIAFTIAVATTWIIGVPLLILMNLFSKVRRSKFAKATVELCVVYIILTASFISVIQYMTHS